MFYQERRSRGQKILADIESQGALVFDVHNTAGHASVALTRAEQDSQYFGL
ncbi:hypothetical protein [Methylibium sp. T29]|uniref:hypothetical protein n=1 Tax=Methylibium sp. T29 TaxID=1430884 RepID=UPI0004B3C509|nr:hypothetical protein [Methylibium sp. T29]